MKAIHMKFVNDRRDSVGCARLPKLSAITSDKRAVTCKRCIKGIAEIEAYNNERKL